MRHAAMESMVDVLRSSELDPRTLVPPCLLPPGADPAHFNVPMLHIDCMAAWQAQPNWVPYDSTAEGAVDLQCLWHNHQWPACDLPSL